MTMESKPTAGAQRAMGLARLVNQVFAKERVRSTVEGHAGYFVEMAGPEALSTSERKGALDQLKLMPVDATKVGSLPGSGTPLLIGTADPNLSQVELRTYERLTQLHAERFDGAVLPVDAAAYEALRKKISEFFESQGISTVSVAARSDRSLSPSVRPRRSPVLALLVVGGLILIALAAFALRSR